MTQQEFDRVRAAARELEAAINAIPNAIVEVAVEQVAITRIDDALPQRLHRLLVMVRGESVRVYP